VAFPMKKKAVAAGIALAGLGLLFSRSASAKPSAKKATCPPFPVINRVRVIKIAEQAISGGMTGVERVAAFVGQQMFPIDPATNEPVGWPMQAPFTLPVNATEHAQCLYDELILIITTGIDVPIDPNEPQSPAKVFNDLISSDPTPGKFWKIKKGWTAAGVGSNRMLYQALRKISPTAAKDGKRRLDYLDCVTRSGWNQQYYGVPEATRNAWPQKTQNNWPPMYSFDGFSMWPAFMPWHQDAIAEIVNGRLPERRIGPAGERIQGGTYGLLWLPPVDTDTLVQMGQVACNLTHPDGSPAMDPPEELTALLS
jgi:hypothetical protein